MHISNDLVTSYGTVFNMQSVAARRRACKLKHANRAINTIGQLNAATTTLPLLRRLGHSQVRGDQTSTQCVDI